MSTLEPVSDLGELAEAEKWANATPLSASPYNRPVHDPAGRVVGVNVKAGPPATKADGLRSKHQLELAAAFGQARRLLLVDCRKCRHVAAEWQHIIGQGSLTAEEWQQAKRVRGQDVDPWRGWLWESVTRTAYRDYMDGIAVIMCRCRREIRLDLQDTVLGQLEPRCTDCGKRHVEHTRQAKLRITA